MPQIAPAPLEESGKATWADKPAKDNGKQNGVGGVPPKEDVTRDDEPANQLSTRALVDDEVERQSIGKRIWLFLDDPSSSKPAQVFSLSMILLITFSVIVFCLESLPRFYVETLSSDTTIWDEIEFVCVVIFTSEYLLRLLTCPSKTAFLWDFLNFVDLIAIVPFYLERAASFFLISGDAAIFRVVRLVRVFRVFKISRYLSWIRIFLVAMQNSTQPLSMLLFVMMVVCVFFSSAMFFIERGDFDLSQGIYIRSDGSESPFQSIPGTFWWCLVTMTTVGYGDAYPITPGGKLLAAITSLTGILVLAVPITVISTNFSDEYEKLKKQRATAKHRANLLRNHFKERKSNLDTMQTEVADLVKRASQDFISEMESLAEVAKEEMTLELQELVRIAYSARQKDLVRANTKQSKSARSITPSKIPVTSAVSPADSL